MKKPKLIEFIFTAAFIMIVAGSACNTDRKAAKGMAADTTLSLVVREWSKKIAEYPDNDDYYFQRGQELMRDGRLKLSIADFQKAVELKPDNSPYYIALAEAYFVNNELKNCQSSYEKVLKLEPNNQKALYKIGEFYFFIRQYEESIRYLTQLIGINPAHEKAFYVVASNYKEMKDTARATSYFVKSVQIDPSNYDAFIQLGSLYSNQFDSTGLQYFQAARILDPFSDEASYAEGLLYQRLGQYDSAVKRYQTTVELNPTHYFAWYNTAYINFQLEKWDLAMEQFLRSVNFAPDFAKGQYMVGLCWEAKKNNEEARKWYRKTLETDPNFELAKLGLERIED